MRPMAFKTLCCVSGSGVCGEFKFSGSPFHIRPEQATQKATPESSKIPTADPMAHHFGSSYHTRKTGGGGVYVPPDFEPHYRPNVFVPSDADEHNVTPKTTTEQISHYETLSDTDAFGQTEIVGDQTGAYVAGGTRRVFHAGPYVPPDVSITEQVQAEDADRSVSFVKHVDTGVVKTAQASAAVTTMTALNLPDINSFRGPDLNIPGRTFAVDFDGSTESTLATAPPVIDAKQPSWPPTFGKKDTQAHDQELPQVSEPPAQVQVLPVDSLVSSDDSSKFQRVSQSAFSDGRSASPTYNTDYQAPAPSSLPSLQPAAASSPKLSKREKLGKLCRKAKEFLSWCDSLHILLLYQFPSYVFFTIISTFLPCSEFSHNGDGRVRLAAALTHTGFCSAGE